ncbi:unnamed protein product, partial [Mesorhabditis spiculigera]
MVQHLQKLDELLSDKRNYLASYDEAKKLLAENENDVEVAWRWIQACHQKALALTVFADKKVALIEGRELAQRLVVNFPEHGQLLKWAAMTTGKSVEFVGLTDKVRQGKIFKEYLDRASKLLPDDHRLLHLRARYKFSMSQMSWIERKAVNALFTDPPNSTIEDALADFLELHEKEPLWLDNLLYLGKCYSVIKDKAKAAEFLEKCLTQPAIDDEDEHHHKEARECLSKLK